MKSYTLKKRALKYWLFRHRLTVKEFSEKLQLGEKELNTRLEFWEYFSCEEIERLVYLMGAREAFYVIYFPTYKERCRVYYETFGKKWRKRRKQIGYGRSKKVHE